jgi:hypothetical protein
LVQFRNLADRSARQGRDMLIALRELIDEAGREIDLFELSRE